MLPKQKIADTNLFTKQQQILFPFNLSGPGRQQPSSDPADPCRTSRQSEPLGVSHGVCDGQRPTSSQLLSTPQFPHHLPGH